jgi:hypothetical protein
MGIYKVEYADKHKEEIDGAGLVMVLRGEN